MFGKKLIDIVIKILIDFVWKVDLLDFSWASVLSVSMSSVSIGLRLKSSFTVIAFLSAYVFTVRNLFDVLVKRSRQIFVEKLQKRQSEDFRRKSRVSFNVEKYWIWRITIVYFESSLLQPKILFFLLLAKK